MADPISLSALAIGGMAASAAGGVVSALGQVMGGQSQGNMYTYQAGVAQMNTQIAKQNADYARVAGEVSAQESGMKTRAMVPRTPARSTPSRLATRWASAASWATPRATARRPGVGFCP